MTTLQERPLRIWHANITRNTSHVDGVTAAIDELARWQRQLGHDVTVVRQIPGRPSGSGNQHPDIVHLHSVFRPKHAELAYHLYRAGIPYVTSPHSGLATDALRRDRVRKRAYFAICEQKLLAHAATVICLTETEAEELRAVAGSEISCTVVPNIASIPAKGGRPWTPSIERPNLVCLSRFDVWQKGLDTLAAIAQWLPELDVTVYGAADHNQPGRVDRLRRSAPRNFHLVAPVHGAKKVTTLTTASLYVQTSRWEGLSMSVIEAMATGVPCAVSGYIARSMELADGKAALVLCADPVHAAAQIRSALTDQPSLQAMAGVARDRASARYNGYAVAAASIAAYRAAMGTNAVTETQRAIAR